jgi:DNA primase
VTGGGRRRRRRRAKPLRPLISPETIALIRERTDIVALIQESVPSLKKRGRSWTGLCPFHKEKSPSFNVNQDRGFFKCFGCGESGDAFTFAMKEFGYTFHEAAHVLAERAGIVIEEESRERSEIDRAKKQKDDLYAVNALAATWFEEQMRKHPLRSFALDELARRGVVPGEKPEVDEALKAFRVGYAPHEWDGLANFLRQQGVSPVAAESVGLLSPRSSGSGHYDRFRHRLMFAVVDTQGRVVAFSGRALADPPGAEAKPDGDKPAKYINSKESPIYTKGNVLFGLFQARHAIRTEEIALVVEGNFDVFSLHARGLANVVAPLGTAFTVEQATLLKRYTPTVVLLFDGDAAGRKATRASRGPCMEAGLDVKVARLPDGEDPDDFARKRGIEPLRSLAAHSKGMLEFLIDAELDESFVAADGHERLARVERIAQLIASEEDPLARMMAKGHADSMAGRLDFLGADTFRALEQKIRTAARAPRLAEGLNRKVARSEGAGPANPPPAFRPSALPVQSSPLPARPAASRAHSTPKTAAQIERRDMVGALLDYPSLLADPEVLAACVHLEGPAVLTVAALRKAHTQEKGLDTAAFLAQIPPAIQVFAQNRLAVPEHESEGKAKEALLASAQRLERLILAQDIVDISRDLENDADLEKLRDAQERAERASGIKGINARSARTSGLGATPHEERPFEEARHEGSDGGGRREGVAGEGGQGAERPLGSGEPSQPGEEPRERSAGEVEREAEREPREPSEEERDTDDY